MHLQSAQREERLSQPGSDDRRDRGRRGRHRRGQPRAVREHGRHRDRRRRRDDEPVDGGAPRRDRAHARARGRRAARTTTTSSSPRARRRELANVPVHVVPSRSLQAGLAAMLAFDPLADAAANARAMEGAATAIATGGVTVASRAVSVDGLQVERGALPRPRRRRAGRGRDELRHRRRLGRRPPARRAARRPHADHRRGRARARPAARASRRTAPGPRARGASGRPAALSAFGIRRVTP